MINYAFNWVGIFRVLHNVDDENRPHYSLGQYMIVIVCRENRDEACGNNVIVALARFVLEYQSVLVCIDEFVDLRKHFERIVLEDSGGIVHQAAVMNVTPGNPLTTVEISLHGWLQLDVCYIVICERHTINGNCDYLLL